MARLCGSMGHAPWCGLSVAAQGQEGPLERGTFWSDEFFAGQLQQFPCLQNPFWQPLSVVDHLSGAQGQLKRETRLLSLL